MCVGHDRSLGRLLRLWQLFHTGARSWWHRRRHVMSDVPPGGALTSLLSSFTRKGHNLTPIVRQVGRVLMSSLTNVPRLHRCIILRPTGLGPEAALCSSFSPCASYAFSMNRGQDVKSESILMRLNTYRRSDPYIIYFRSSRSVVSSNRDSRWSILLPLRSRTTVGKKKTTKNLFCLCLVIFFFSHL